MTNPLQMVLDVVTLPFEKLRQYQEEDFYKGIACPIFGAFLDLGLGKTILSILIAVYKLLTNEFDRAYVLCPASLITQWMGVLESLGLNAVAYRGTPKQREKIDLEVDFLVVSFQIFQQDYERLKRSDAYIIVDEATILCQVSNILYKMLAGGEVRKKLPMKEGQLKPEFSIRRLNKIMFGGSMLSATPTNKNEDAYGIISLKTPGIYTNYNQFLRIHVDEYDYFNKPKSYKSLDLLRDNLLLNSSHRLVTDHIDLPPIIFKTVFYDLSSAHQELYDKLLNEKFLELDGKVMIDALQAVSLFHWSQRIILAPEKGGLKEEAVIFELLSMAISSMRNFIIFSNYVDSNKSLMSKFNIGGIFGGATPKQKDQAIKDFTEGKLNGLTIHPKSGGQGLNLQCTHNVLFPELPVTPRDFRQCCGRVYRSGQDSTVVVTVFVAKDTVQQSIFNRVLKRDLESSKMMRVDNLLQDSLSSNEFVQGKISKKELLEVLRGKG